jgi:hypothetical protein
MVTASVMVGSSVVGRMGFTSFPGTLGLSGMPNLMRSAPGVSLASSITCRSDPDPESLVLVTVKVVSARADSAASTRLALITPASNRPKTRDFGFVVGIVALARIISFAPLLLEGAGGVRARPLRVVYCFFLTILMVTLAVSVPPLSSLTL